MLDHELNPELTWTPDLDKLIVYTMICIINMIKTSKGYLVYYIQS